METHLSTTTSTLIFLKLKLKKFLSTLLLKRFLESNLLIKYCRIQLSDSLRHAKWQPAPVSRKAPAGIIRVQGGIERRVENRDAQLHFFSEVCGGCFTVDKASINQPWRSSFGFRKMMGTNLNGSFTVEGDYQFAC
ncbi:hypothetical protein NPIL_215261 [Nephila pilipes]|uniref:Uncharacterized protein n=1 Tax=Nephila pilipes TaxID=299642 RepID=A0A8X6NZZ8_NEPPI|nr:hypothetical protein NPIL_215261 [Nephila pilipes]